MTEPEPETKPVETVTVPQTAPLQTVALPMLLRGDAGTVTEIFMDLKHWCAGIILKKV